MFRALCIPIVFSSFLPVALAQDYVAELTRLSELAGAKQYREAIAGYRKLESQPGTPPWLEAASEYEIAELYGTQKDTDNAVAALGRAVQLGFDDCLTPRASQPLAAVLQNPKAAQALAAMQIAEADYRELAWLKSEVQHADHDIRMMITENMNRVDQGATEIPQAELPTRPTTSPAVLYWRQQLLLMQRAQREWVQKSDLERMAHATKMATIGGGTRASAALESARLAHAAAEQRKLDIHKRAFVPVTPSSTAPKACSEWK